MIEANASRLCRATVPAIVRSVACGVNGQRDAQAAKRVASPTLLSGEARFCPSCRGSVPPLRAGEARAADGPMEAVGGERARNSRTELFRLRAGGQHAFLST